MDVLDEAIARELPVGLNGFVIRTEATVRTEVDAVLQVETRPFVAPVELAALGLEPEAAGLRVPGVVDVEFDGSRAIELQDIGSSGTDSFLGWEDE